jgi:hypothetical protein
MVDFLAMYDEIRQIRGKIDSVKHTQEVLIRAHREPVEKQIWDRMDNDDVLARVYLLVDGNRTQKDIAKEMQSDGVYGATTSTVSRKLETLREDLDLIELSDHPALGNVYKRTATDRILGIAKTLKRRREKAILERK